MLSPDKIVNYSAYLQECEKFINSNTFLNYEKKWFDCKIDISKNQNFNYFEKKVTEFIEKKLTISKNNVYGEERKSISYNFNEELYNNASICDLSNMETTDLPEFYVMIIVKFIIEALKKKIHFTICYSFQRGCRSWS